TRFSRDWSSDVCSSDLDQYVDRLLGHGAGVKLERRRAVKCARNVASRTARVYCALVRPGRARRAAKCEIFPRRVLQPLIAIAGRSEERRVGNEAGLAST